MDDLVEWLKRQLDEDERDADGIHRYEGGMSPLTCDHIVAAGHDRCTCGVPAQVLAEVDAKRRIIDSWEASQDDNLPPLALIALDEVVKALALPYADRPGYQESWRP